MSALQLVILVVVLGGWEVAANYYRSQFWSGSPSEIYDVLKEWIQTGILWSALGTTLEETFIGFAIGSAAGAIIGFLLGWYRLAGDVFEPIVLPFYALPKIALAPLLVLIFGIGVEAKVVLVALMVFFIVFFTTFRGMRMVDRDLVVNARGMGAGRIDVWRTIAIPQAAIWVLSGLRLALPSAFHGAIVGEFIAATQGVGFLIRTASTTFDIAGVFAGVFVLLVVSGIILALMKQVERYVLRWQATDSIQSRQDLSPNPS